jgi:hypothetical protein
MGVLAHLQFDVTLDFGPALFKLRAWINKATQMYQCIFLFAAWRI